jgi:hypothetical protein
MHDVASHARIRDVDAVRRVATGRALRRERRRELDRALPLRHRTLRRRPRIHRVPRRAAVNVRFSLPEGLQFCSADGPALKSGSLSGSYGQVYESFGADKDDGSRASFDATKTCRSFWIWNWGNVGAGTEHEYLIRFRDRDGRQCTIDPFFKNG